MASRPKSKKDALMAEVLGLGSQAQESALGASKAPAAPAKPGRPSQGPVLPFTVRLPQEAAQLLQRLVSDLGARAMRGEIARKNATISAVVEAALRLYAEKQGGSK